MRYFVDIENYNEMRAIAKLIGYELEENDYFAYVVIDGNNVYFTNEALFTNAEEIDFNVFKDKIKELEK